jgi:hypothetical protein
MDLGISEASPIFILGVSATVLPHLKLQHKKACFRGEWQGVAAWDVILMEVGGTYLE